MRGQGQGKVRNCLPIEERGAEGGKVPAAGHKKWKEVKKGLKGVHR